MKQNLNPIFFSSRFAGLGKRADKSLDLRARQLNSEDDLAGSGFTSLHLNSKKH
jgi:hypothetical protein